MSKLPPFPKLPPFVVNDNGAPKAAFEVHHNGHTQINKIARRCMRKIPETQPTPKPAPKTITEGYIMFGKAVQAWLAGQKP